MTYPTFRQQDGNRHLAVGFATKMNPRQQVRPVDWVKAARQAGDHLPQKLWRGALPLYDWAFAVIAAAGNGG